MMGKFPDSNGKYAKERKENGQDSYHLYHSQRHRNDTVTGFNIGADDYISKPFSLREVAARVKAVLRRTRQTETERAPEQIAYKSLVLDIIKKKVSIDGEEAPLTKKNLKYCSCYCKTKDAYFPRRHIEPHLE